MESENLNIRDYLIIKYIPLYFILDEKDYPYRLTMS